MKRELTKNIIVAWAGCILTGISFSMVMPFLPLLIKELGVPDSQHKMYSSLAVSITAVSTILFARFWGKQADCYGRKGVMLIASIGTLVVMAGLSMTSQISVLLFLRFISGSLQGYIPYATVLVASELPSKSRPKVLSFISTGLIIGNMIGPSFGGLIGDLYSVRAIFIISSLVAAGCFFITYYFIEEKQLDQTKYIDKNFKTIVKEIKEPFYIVSLIATSFIFRLCTMSINPLILLYMFQLNGQMQENLKFSGLIISLSSLASILSFPLIGKMTEYLSVRKILICGLVMEIFSLTLLANSKNLYHLMIIFLFMGIAQQMIVPSINVEITKYSPQNIRSRVFSYNVISQNLGQVIGPIIGAVIVNHLGFSVLFYFLAVMASILLLALITLMNKKHQLLN